MGVIRSNNTNPKSITNKDVGEFTIDEVNGNHNPSPKSTTTIYPGDKIRLSYTFGTQPVMLFLTAGPRVNSTTFYTAGHCKEVIPPPYANCTFDVYLGYGINKVATLNTMSAIWGWNGDRAPAIVCGSGSLPATNKVTPNASGTYTLVNVTDIGTSVEMRGAVSGLTSGIVLAQNVTINMSGTIIGQLTRADYTCQDGDSGAGIFNRYAASCTTAYCYGVQSIGFFENNNSVSTESYFAPVV